MNINPVKDRMGRWTQTQKDSFRLLVDTAKNDTDPSGRQFEFDGIAVRVGLLADGKATLNLRPATPEMLPASSASTSTKESLTPEKYQEIRTKLENENLESFPSMFQQARNLAKQAWLSGVDFAKGKPLLSTAEKAKARLDICASCAFFSQGRCSKCGCFMDKKAHLDAAQCPINKWGELRVVEAVQRASSDIEVTVGGNKISVRVA